MLGQLFMLFEQGMVVFEQLALSSLHRIQAVARSVSGFSIVHLHCEGLLREVLNRLSIQQLLVLRIAIGFTHRLRDSFQSHHHLKRKNVLDLEMEENCEKSHLQKFNKMKDGTYISKPTHCSPTGPFSIASQAVLILLARTLSISHTTFFFLSAPNLREA